MNIMSDPRRRVCWPHAPQHRLSESGTYFVTVGTYQREHYFRDNRRLEVLHRGLLAVAAEFHWRLEAWAVFSNHYHFIGGSPPEGAVSLSMMLGKLHMKTGEWINGLDQSPGRKVWHNYRETRLTFEKSYLARLHYVHQNPVRHGLVTSATMYPWCSAAWFEKHADPATRKVIESFPIDRVKVFDEYSPVWAERG